jgi:hypothetical protein
MTLNAAQWIQVASVFLSALLAMIVGILLDLFKRHRDDMKAAQEEQYREVQQINGVIASIGFNVETLLHLVMQNILPHQRQSHAAYNALLSLRGDDERIKRFAISLHQYPALMMTCPDMHFIECDFWKELPFIIEKDSELVKQSGWLISHVREIQNVTTQRNKIDAARELASKQGGALSYYVLDSVLQVQASVSNAECVTALEFFRTLLTMAKNLELINSKYKIQGKKSRLIPPPPLQDAMKELTTISQQVIPEMPI